MVYVGSASGTSRPVISNMIFITKLTLSLTLMLTLTLKLTLTLPGISCHKAVHSPLSFIVINRPQVVHRITNVTKTCRDGPGAVLSDTVATAPMVACSEQLANSRTARTIAGLNLVSLGQPCKFQRVSHLGSVLAALLHGTPVVGVSQTLRR